jgi:hypothetical protein
MSNLNFQTKPLHNISSLSIISNEVTEKECYNDYMIKLSEPIKLRDLNINNIQLPKRQSENISTQNNQLEIEIDSSDVGTSFERFFSLANGIINDYNIKKTDLQFFRIFCGLYLMLLIIRFILRLRTIIIFFDGILYFFLFQQ